MVRTNHILGRRALDVEEVVGRRFGTMVVVEQNGPRCRAKCDCGTELIRYVSHLRTVAACSRSCPAAVVRHLRWNFCTSACGRACTSDRSRLVLDRAEVNCDDCLSGIAPDPLRIARRIRQQLKANARSRELPMLLTVEDLLELRVDKSCHYCKSKLHPLLGGLDRIDNAKGYSRDNVLPCCSMCNDARGHLLTVEEFEAAMRVRLAGLPAGADPWGGQSWRSALRA